VPEPIRWRIERQPHPRPAHHRKPLSAFRRLRPFVPCPIPCSHSGCERRRSLLWYAQRLTSERTVSALNRRTGQRTSGNMPEAKRLPRLVTSGSTGIVRVFASDSARCASVLAVSPLILVTLFRDSAKIAVPRQFLIVEIRQWLDPRVCIDILGHCVEVVILDFRNVPTDQS
jgi:hypothetical protein